MWIEKTDLNLSKIYKSEHSLKVNRPYQEKSCFVLGTFYLTPMDYDISKKKKEHLTKLSKTKGKIFCKQCAIL